MPRQAFGRSVLGPIFAEFALRLHMYLLAVDEPSSARLLFCARGGLRLRRIYEAFLEASGLSSPVAFGDLMVSRLIAARSAVASGASGASDAYQELAREFQGESLGAVVEAFAQMRLAIGDRGSAPFQPDALAALLAEKTPESEALRDRLAAQNRLFAAHLNGLRGDAGRLILCDTGLYGSTLRLLRAGSPDLAWSCVLFARSNYKGFDESHFAVTTGLSVEANAYSALYPRTAVLRYWHLIESALEPDLPSVTSFDLVDGSPRANLETPGWQDKVNGAAGDLFAGIIAYIEALPGAAAAETIYRDAPGAWVRLHRSIVWPTAGDVETMLVGGRSRDYGRRSEVEVIVRPGLRGGWKDVRQSLWREGYLTRAFPRTRLGWLGAIQGAHLGRTAMKLLRGRA